MFLRYKNWFISSFKNLVHFSSGIFFLINIQEILNSIKHYLSHPLSVAEKEIYGNLWNLYREA